MSARLFVAMFLVAAGCKREAAMSASASPADAGTDAARAIAACGPTDPVVPDADGLAFLQQVVGTLRIELTEPPTRFAPTDLRPEQPSPTAAITAVVLAPYKLDHGERVPLTAAELDRVIFRGTVLRLRSFGKVVEHTAADCDYTLRDLIGVIEATELRVRADNPWTASIDLHHVYFQGLSPAADGTWRVSWAS